MKGQDFFVGEGGVKLGSKKGNFKKGMGEKAVTIAAKNWRDEQLKV